MLDKKEIETLSRLYKEHKSLRSVAKITGRSPNTVDKYIQKDSQINRKNIVESYTPDQCLIGVYVGLWLGDGTQYLDKGYRIKICSNKEDKQLNFFIQDVILRLFKKRTNLIEEKNTKQAWIKFNSKFIFNFINNYVDYGHNKTLTACLKKETTKNNDFLEGCLLGLTLSDGYLKRNFRFNVISYELANDVTHILKNFGMNPKLSSIHREKYDWHTLHGVWLSAKESRKAEEILNKIIKKLGYNLSFKEIKYGPAETFSKQSI